jgi:hypothetical protein
MSFATELQRYLTLGINLQHRRIERGVGVGKSGTNNAEEIVKWKQDRREGSLQSTNSFPANWGVVYETVERWELSA